MPTTEFAPLSGFLGGVLIGLSALVLMLGNGRIAGASDIFAGLISAHWDSAWRSRLVFVLGMLIGAAWMGLLAYDANAIAFPAGVGATVIGGLLVGLGTQLGSGCTSGHGICGLARLSKRSLVATLTFMAAAALTVFITRHGLGAR